MNSRTTQQSNLAPRKHEEDSQLRAYREWALQSTTLSLFDSGMAWTGRPTVLGLEDAEEADGPVRGQAELQRMLEPAADAGMRIRTMALLGAGGLAALSLVQFAGFGIELAGWQFAAIALAVAATTAVVLVFFSRLNPASLAIAEQAAMVMAWLIVAALIAFTGGAESPFVAWWLFPASYSAYFMFARRAYANAGVISVLVLSPVVYDPSGADVDSLFTLVLTANVAWALTWLIVTGCAKTHSAERAVRFLALADPLTGVANLRSFEPMLERLMSDPKSRFTLCVVEMRGLKGANASFGYDAGDDMLRRMAALLMHACSERDQVARLRGDEFAVLLSDSGQSETTAWRERLETALDEHNAWVRSRVPRLVVSIGSAEYPRDGENPESLFDSAERMLSERRADSVKPPYEVDLPAKDSAAGLLTTDAAEVAVSSEDKRHSQSEQDAARWLFATCLFVVWALVPGANVSSSFALVAVAAVFAVMAAASFFTRNSTLAATVTVVSDWVRMMVIVPVVWLTGGWASPLQIATFFPVTYYAQFKSGRAAAGRIGGVIALYVFAFWTAESAGAADGPPTSNAQTLLFVIVGTQLVIAALLQANRRETDAAIDQIRRSAVFDPVTSVRNLRGFRSELTMAVEAVKHSPVATRAAPAGVSGHLPVPALALVDINDFRSVNNLGGYLAGDALLRETADRVREVVGESGTVFRIDADEFAVLTRCEDPESHSELLADLRSHLERISAPTEAGVMRASVGGAVWRHGEEAESLLEAARTSLAAAGGRHTHNASGVSGQTML